jgi:hypothetical protein
MFEDFLASFLGIDPKHMGKCDPAWGFSQTHEENRSPMEKRIRREMEESLSQQRRHLAVPKRTLVEWSRPWRRSAKRPKKRPPPPAKAKAGQPKSMRSSKGPEIRSRRRCTCI